MPNAMSNFRWFRSKVYLKTQSVRVDGLRDTYLRETHEAKDKAC
jgi:hypothetical protein